MYQGAGRRIVSRSHTAIDTRTVLVGVSMVGLVSTMMMMVLEMNVKSMRTGIKYP